MVKEIYLLVDSWTTLSLLHARQESVARPAQLAAYAAAAPDVQAVVVFEGRQPPPSAPAALRLGRWRGHEVWLAIPTMARLAHDWSMPWSRYAQAELARQYISCCRIAHLQTVGGAYASLRQADRALECAIQLYETALSIHEEDILRKCRVFIGWAHLWNGSLTMSLQLFELALEDARQRGDIVQQRRCEHAIINAKTNPTLQPTPGERPFTLTDCWTSAFADHELHRITADAETDQLEGVPRDGVPPAPLSPR